LLAAHRIPLAMLITVNSYINEYTFCAMSVIATVVVIDTAREVGRSHSPIQRPTSPTKGHDFCRDRYR
jgi:hypothetical protein